MPVVTFIDSNGVKHDALVGATRDEHPHHLSLIYVDSTKDPQVFNTGAWEDNVVRVVDATRFDHESKDQSDPRNCWVPQPGSFGAAIQKALAEPEPDVIAELEKAGKPAEDHDPGDESK